MTITLLILLVLAAISLILVEIFVIPGVGIPGIAGILLLLACIYLAYAMDSTIGHITLGTAGVASLLLIYLSLNAKTWERVSTKYAISSRVGSEPLQVEVGDQGVAMGRLNPMGKARFKEEIIEVQSRGGYIEANGPLEIIKIERRKVFVKPLNKA